MCAKPRRLLAFVDESESHRQPGAPAYILAAGVCESSAVVGIRAEVEGLRLKGQRKLHWHDESPARRHAIAEAVGHLPLRHVVVVRTCLDGERTERRRRLCLERMLYELDQLRVARAVFESRGPADDRRDRAMLDALRARRAVSSDLRVGHEKGPTEALLWVPDAVCGAVASHRRGEPTYLDIIEKGAEVRIITLSG